MACLITSGLASSCAYGVGGNSDIYLANWESIAANGWTDTSSPLDGVLDKVTFKNTTTITDVTNANPGVATAVAHGLSEGDTVVIIGTSPMTGLVGTHTVGATTADTFALTGFNSTSLSAFAGSSVEVQPDGFFLFSAVEDTLSTDSQEVRSNGNVYFNQTVVFNAGANSLNQAFTDNADALGLARLVAVVRNKSGSWTIYGQTNGLTALIQHVHGAGTGDFGGFIISLTGVEVFNPKFWDNDTNGLPVVES